MVNRLPPHWRDKGDKGNDPRFEHVKLFEERLIDLQESLVATAHSAHRIEPDLTEDEQKELASEYRMLASFTGMLANAAKKLDAEISERDVVFRNPDARLSPLLMRQLHGGMDKALIDEIGGNYDDGDKANFAQQVHIFTEALRDRFKQAPHRG